MVLLIVIFSINRIQGYENCFLGYYCNIALLYYRFPPQRGKWTLLSIIKVFFLVLFWYYFGIIVVLFSLYCCSYAISSYLFLLCILFYVWNITSGIKAPSSVEKSGLIFIRVETYSNIFKLQRYFVTRINLSLGIHTHRKYKCYLGTHLLATLVTPVGTPSSGSASENTFVRINLDFLKPSVDKPIGHLTVIVPPRTKLRKILSSTWVVR